MKLRFYDICVIELNPEQFMLVFGGFEIFTNNSSPHAAGLGMGQLAREQQRWLHATLNNCFIPLKVASFPCGGNVQTSVLF